MSFLQQGSSAQVVVPLGQSIIIGAYRNALATLLTPTGQKTAPIITLQDGVQTYGPYTVQLTVIVCATYGEIEYVVGASPVLTDNTYNPAAIVATQNLKVTVGGTGTTLTNPTLQATNSVNNFTQIAIQNKLNGASSSADHISYPDNNSTDLNGFCDSGVCSSTFSDAAYTITGPNDAYLFGSAVSGAGKAGNLVICTDSTGSANAIVFGTGGFLAANERMRLKAGGALNFKPLASAPVTDVAEGDIYYNSTLHKLQVRTASAWETITSA